MPAQARQLMPELLDQQRLRLHFRYQSADQLLQFARFIGQAMLQFEPERL